MVVSGKWFESGIFHMCTTYVAATNVDWNTDVTAGDVYAILTDDSPDAHYTDWDHYDDVTGELATANGYTAGGLALAAPTVGVVTDVTRFLRFDADDLVWAAPFTAGPFRYIIIYKDSGADATSPLICYHDLGAETTGAGGAFQYTFSVLGGACRIEIPHV